ncbi:hypothetical protein [Methyloversatilis discipulorum]|uniref:hypothetical protein n=1 Tax=Methyloversatilis discipulorum TaxID=1119528 RepID=UPI003137EC2C
MCADYTPTRQAAWEKAFRATFPAGEFKPEAFPGYTAPILTSADPDAGRVEAACTAAEAAEQVEVTDIAHVVRRRGEGVALHAAPPFRASRVCTTTS